MKLQDVRDLHFYYTLGANITKNYNFFFALKYYWQIAMFLFCRLLLLILSRSITIIFLFVDRVERVDLTQHGLKKVVEKFSMNQRVCLLKFAFNKS